MEWLANQSWSNGRVGMYGGSYDGQTQIATATLQPPHLVTIVPVASLSSGYDFVYYEGVQYIQNGAAVMAQYAAISAPPGQDPNTIANYPERIQCQPANFQAGLDQSGDWNAYWEARDFRPFASQIRASVLQVQGLQDGTVKPDGLDNFWNNITSEKRLILGQWGHADPDRKDWPEILHRWFDHYLLGIDTGILKDLPPVLVEDTTGTWRGLESFPLPTSENVTLYLTPEGKLAPISGPKAILTIQDYPRGAADAALWSAPPIQSLGKNEVNPDRLLFTSEPLSGDLHVSGRPLVYLVATTSAKSTHWVARLVDADAEVRPDNPYDSGAYVNIGYLNARHRFGVREPQDLTPGQPYAATVRLHIHDDVIPKGHRLRLILDNTDPTVQQDTTFATSMIQLGDADGTRIVFGLATPGIPIPENVLRPDLG